MCQISHLSHQEEEGFYERGKRKRSRYLIAFTLRSTWLRCQVSNTLSQVSGAFKNRLSAVKPYHRAFNFSSWYVKREAKRTVPQKIVVSKPFQSEISSVYLMSLEVLHFFQSSDISPYKSRVSVQVNPWHWTLFTNFNKYPVCSKTSHLMIHYYVLESIVYHNATP